MSRGPDALRIAGVIATLVVLAVLIWPERAVEPAGERSSGAAGQGGDVARAAGAPPEPRRGRPGPDPAFVVEPSADLSTPVPVVLRRPPRAGLMFDVATGEILWKRAAGRRLAIASLTKLMTALLISQSHRPGERVRISRRAARTGGSKLGVLTPGRTVRLESLFHALIMISANDAAVALAEHDAGTVERFVRRMNRQAAAMGLDCTRFSGPSGLRDRGNHSCALDLAALARASLADRRIARVARRRRVSFPFRGKVRTLDLYNNHYFLTRGIAGIKTAKVTGLKTGYTNAAGRCYMTTARFGGRHLGVVLLDSPDPLKQVPKLLRAGFGVNGGP